jgi:hypothetical protein
MDRRSAGRFLRIAPLIAAMCLVACSPSPAASAAKRKRPLILVHYMPWFTAKPASPTWGWHWTMNAFDPDQKAQGKRRIASHYYPLIGPYDSGDPAVFEYHALLMKLVGIDGLIADWYGLANQVDYPLIHRNTAALFQSAARLGLRVAVCYEDQTVSRLVQAKKLAAADRVRHVRAEIDWLRRNWFARPGYVRVAGKPLLLSFGFDGLTDRDWEQVFLGKRDRPLYLSEHRRRNVAAGAFDWPVPKDHRAALDRFYKQMKDWPVAMPAAFPRFHDIYREAKVHPSWGHIPDNGGRTFQTTLRRALQSGAPVVQIVTWNDWGEGTSVEPSAEFGYRNLEAVQQLRRQLFGADFRFKAADLRLPHRLFILRRKGAKQRQGKDKLDKIARLVAAGSLSAARAALKQIEAGSRNRDRNPVLKATRSGLQ